MKQDTIFLNYLLKSTTVVMILVTIFYTIKNKKNSIKQYLKETKDINKNIIFPEKKQIQKTFFLVILVCCILGFSIWLIDITVIFIVKKILLN